MNLHQQNKKELLDFVKHKIGAPVNCHVVMATIESMGVRDKDIFSDYGMNSLKDLATEVFLKLSASNHIPVNSQKLSESIPVSGYLRIKAKLFAIYYPLGLLHFIPVLVQLIAIVIFGYSLWTYVGFNQLQSTAVVLGVIIGMICTGGFVQIIGRQASFYWNYKNYTLMNKTINYLVRIGIQSVLIVFALIFIANYFINFYPYSVILIIFIYALLIGALLLILAPMHTIKQRWVVSVAVGLGTLFALGLKEFTNISIYMTHWAGIVSSIIISKIYLLYFFNKHIASKPSEDNVLRVQQIIYHNYQYFFYGILVYVFIFIDRILAWSSEINRAIPYTIYYEKDYEIGMDLAILVFLLLTGVLEYSIASFSKFLDISQKLTNYAKPKGFGRKLLKLYWQHIAMLIGTTALIFILIYLIITSSWGYEAQFNETLNSLSIHVCIIGGFGYFFLAWGMLNSLYMFTLNQPKAAIKALVIAIVVNLIVGMFMSRVFAYELSVIGMLAGGLTFFVLTLNDCLNYYKNLDYYYYAAY